MGPAKGQRSLEGSRASRAVDFQKAADDDPAKIELKFKFYFSLGLKVRKLLSGKSESIFIFALSVRRQFSLLVLHAAIILPRFQLCSP